MRRIGIVTGTRADFGLLYRTILLLQSDNRFDTCVFACGTHLSPDFGLTINELIEKNVKNIVFVDMLLSSGSRLGVAKSVGLATISFADKLHDANLDCLLIIADRYEMLAAAQAAMILNIPIAHIHGGEITEGAFDDSIRHCLTKLANIHFPVADVFANRLRQLGEQDNSIFVVGAPGVDNIANEPRLSVCELQESLGFNFKKPLALITYHPVTRGDSKENNISPLVNAIINHDALEFIITYPNADGGGDQIIKQWKDIQNHEHVHLVPSLGFIRYLSLMSIVECVIGNSSSGIIEAPAFGVPTINIGTRQLGRPQAKSILNCCMDTSEIYQSIQYAMTPAFKLKYKDAVNPYGEGDTANKIVEILASIEFEKFIIKKFKDIVHDE